MNDDNKTNTINDLLGKFDEIGSSLKRKRPAPKASPRGESRISGAPNSARPDGVPAQGTPRPAVQRPSGAPNSARPQGAPAQGSQRPPGARPSGAPDSARPQGAPAQGSQRPPGARPSGAPNSARPQGAPAQSSQRPLGSRPSGAPNPARPQGAPAQGSQRPPGARPDGKPNPARAGNSATQGNSRPPAPRPSGKPNPARPSSTHKAGAKAPAGRSSLGRPSGTPRGNANPDSKPNGARPGGGSRPPGSRPPGARGGRPLPPGKAGKRKRGRKKHHVLKSILASIFLVVLVIMAAGVLYVYSSIKDLPEVDPKAIATLLNNSSTIYDDEGKPIKNIYIGDEQREIVSYDQIPKTVRDAFIAIEDKTFEEHHGFNWIRIAGAVKESIFGGGSVSGTSTITQQLARNIWLTDSRTDYDMNRKIKEAYYSVQLEKKLGKEEILTDYLNMVALGHHSYGVQAAAKNYFDKDVANVDLLESAALASLPQAPSVYTMIVTKPKGSVAKDDPSLLKKGRLYDYVYNGKVEDRLKTVLQFMLDQERITQAEYDEALAGSLRDHIVVTEPSGDDTSSFFVNYAINNVAKDLMKHYPDKAVDLDIALQMVYTGGYEIYSTMSHSMQAASVEEFANGENFPGVTLKHVDGNNNILDADGRLILYRYSNLFEKDVFTFTGSEAKLQEDGSLIIYKSTGKDKPATRLNLYSTTVGGQPDVSIEFKDIYERDGEGRFYIIRGGFINVPQGYKTLDDKGNCIISATFMAANPEFFTIDKKISLSNKNATVTLPDGKKTEVQRYTLEQKIRQPQGAFVVLENDTGRVKAMVGGRSVEGEMTYNRATKPRQPGSTMKPISVYAPAIQMSAEGKAITGEDTKSYGKYWSPVSIIMDEKMTYSGRTWPHNWYSGYRGGMTMRKSIEQSVNVNAVKVQLSIGSKASTEFLKKLGISTLVEKGSANDMNPAALALGGMTTGISPLEMASAYSAFPNKGVHNDPIAYSEVKQRDGTVVLDGKADTTKAMDPGTAFIMTDMLRTTVTSGLGSNAQLPGVPTAGKTGTTSEKYDFWFVGFTPKYSAAVWIGADMNIDMTGSSGNAAALWRKVMARCLKDTKAGTFPEQPSDVVKASVSGYSDYFIKGTVPSYVANASTSATICTESGYLATPWCPHTEKKTYKDGNAPKYYCNLHNTSPGKYPIPPDKKNDSSFDPDKKEPAEETPATPVEPVTPPADPATPPPVDPAATGRRKRIPRAA